MPSAQIIRARAPLMHIPRLPKKDTGSGVFSVSMAAGVRALAEGQFGVWFVMF